MPLSLPTSSALFRNWVTLPRCASGVRSRRILSSFLAGRTRQTDSRPWRGWRYRLREARLSSSLTSPSGAGALSVSASPSIRGINDSIVWRHAIVCWDSCEFHGRGNVKEVERTSQYCKMTERPPATDLRGGKTSEDSFTMLTASLVVAYVVDFQLGFFSCAVAGLMAKCLSPGADWVG